MISDAGRVTVGLGEPDAGQVGVALSSARGAIRLLRSRLEPQYLELLKRANVVVLSGPWGRWHRFDAQVWIGLGKRVDPSLFAVLTTYQVQDDCTVSSYDQSDPPVMLESWRLLPPYTERTNHETEKLRKAATKLRGQGILYHPHATSRRGLDYLLGRKKLSLDGLNVVETTP